MSDYDHTYREWVRSIEKDAANKHDSPKRRAARETLNFLKEKNLLRPCGHTSSPRSDVDDEETVAMGNHVLTVES